MEIRMRVPVTKRQRLRDLTINTSRTCIGLAVGTSHTHAALLTISRPCTCRDCDGMALVLRLIGDAMLTRHGARTLVKIRGSVSKMSPRLSRDYVRTRALATWPVEMSGGGSGTLSVRASKSADVVGSSPSEPGTRVLSRWF